MFHNKKRFFSFGCSFTKYSYATWADFIGSNFLEFYNYGRSGASNVYIFNKFIECIEKHKINPETDFVMIGLTGFSRFSFLKDNRWYTNGEINCFTENNPDTIEKTLLDVMWDDNWAIYNSWVSIKAMENILDSKNIENKIFMSIDNTHFLENPNLFNLSNNSIELLKDVLTKYPTSFDCWVKNKYKSKDYTVWLDNGKHRIDGHPTQAMHYEFVKTFYPEFITEKTDLLLQTAESIFTNESQYAQGNVFRGLQKEYEQSYNFPLFGD